MNDVRYTKIDAEEDGQRLDNYLIRILKGVPKSLIYRIIRSGEVRVNKKRAKPSKRLEQGDLVRIPPLRSAEEKEITPGKNIAKRLIKAIIYEDQHFLVINKPSGIAVHGGSGVSLGVIEALRKIRTDIPYLELVHRLDKETSGCLLLAKKRSILRALQALFEARSVQKTYWMLLANAWEKAPEMVLDVPLKKNILQSGERMVRVDEQGKAAITNFKLMENYPDACLVEAKPSTGRTHQLRVHSHYLGHPILGDQKYGSQPTIKELDFAKQRLYLHARKIEFTLREKNYVFLADLDERFKKTIAQLRLTGSIHE